VGLIANLAKLGVAKKIYDELKKPENQAKIKRAATTAAEKTKAARARRSRVG
jgi:hypothetical protein